MSTTTGSTGLSSHPARALAVVGAVSIAQVVLVLLFAWSASRAAPHHLPIAVAGPPQASGPVAHGIGAARPGAFDIKVLPDDGAARSAVTGRQVYAALSIGRTGATLYTASAASPTVAQLLSQAIPAAVRQASPGATVTITDLAPNPTDDRNGAGLTIALIPICITSIAAGALLTLLVTSRRTRVAAVLGYAAATGLLSELILQTVLGVLTGNWLATAATLGLACLAISAAGAAAVAALGIPGIGLAGFVIFFFGFPFSGATSAWQFVPTPWGQVAQYLPVGAADTSLRAVAFFAGSSSGPPLSVLAAWAVLGLIILAFVRRGEATPQSA